MRHTTTCGFGALSLPYYEAVVTVQGATAAEEAAAGEAAAEGEVAAAEEDREAEKEVRPLVAAAAAAFRAEAMLQKRRGPREERNSITTS